MGARAVVIYTTGVAGSGKTYVRCARFLVDEFLPYTDKKIISNYPWNRELIADTVAAIHGMEREKVLARMVTIPNDVLEKWRVGESGPWDYFRNVDLTGCHVALDEIHNFCGKHQDKEHRRRWQLWLGEIRHRDATIEFLTQNPHKVAKEIDYECGVRYAIENCENIRDPVLGITCSDWYEPHAAFVTGKYVPTIHQVESIQQEGRWYRSHVRRYVLDPSYYQYYDSFSAPVTGGNKGKGELRDFQKYSKPLLIFHIIRRNGFPLLCRFAVIGFLYWLLMCGGIRSVMHGAMDKVVGAITNKRNPAEAKPNEPAKVNAESPKHEKAKSEPAKDTAALVPGTAPNQALAQLPIHVAGSNPSRVSILPMPTIPVTLLPPLLGEKTNEPEESAVQLICVAAWDQGAVFTELGSLLIGEGINGYRLERSSSRGAWVNGVFCRVGVRSSPIKAVDGLGGFKRPAKNGAR